MITLNTQQTKARELILEWFKNKNKQVFVLSGYAGTGKTTLINYIINELNLRDKIAFATPTGKAASVLIQKGSLASTIHHLIYTPVEKNTKVEINGKEVKIKKTEFIKKRTIGDYKLIVIDEISMVSNEILNDLLSYKIPLLVTGDPAQLPPVASDYNKLLETPDYTLTEIVRQAKDNMIIQMANKVRNNEKIYFGQNVNYDDQVIIYNKKLLTQYDINNLMLSVDQILCGRNSTREKLNKDYRYIKGFNSNYPIDGEKLICNLNNYEITFEDKYNIANGIQGSITNFKILDEDLKLAKIDFKPDFSDEAIKDILIDYNVFITGQYLYPKHQTIYLTYEGKYKPKLIITPEVKTSKNFKAKIREEKQNKLSSIGEFMANQFDYSYAISVHKAQGSEWDTILIFDESYLFGKDANKWLYTAITRGKKKVIIIR